MPTAVQENALSVTFHALSDPTRRTVVARLTTGPATVGRLAAEHAMSLPAFSKHVGVLVDAGLVTRRKTGRTVVCSLRPAALGPAQAWLGDMTAFWSANLDRLDTLLTSTTTTATTTEPEDR